MKLTFRSLLVASAVAASAAGVSAVGVRAQQEPTQQSQPPQSAQTPPSSQDQSSSQPGSQGRDEAAARQQLVQAKQALMDLTKLPEASQLQGDARTGVIQIINSFNSLVTAENNWYDRYQDVHQQLGHILNNDVSGSGAASGQAGAVGTSGSSAASLPAPVRDKLVEFQQHLDAFAKAAGAPDNAAAPGSGSGLTSSSAPGVAGSTGSSSSSSPQSAASSSQGTASQGTTGSSSAQGAVTSAAGETFQQHFDAINDLVQQALSGSPSPGSSAAGTSGSSSSGTSTSGTSGSSTSGTSAGQQGTAASAGAVSVDRATLEQIQSHLQRLRQLARERGIQ
jgi:hypothetical protein